MALNGSFSGAIRDGNYKLRVDWSATQSVANNTSKITCSMYLVQAGSWSLNIATRADNVTNVAGSAYTWASPAISNSGGKTTKLATITSGNISHNADGTKSVTITATFYIKATISGTYYEKITATDTITLNTIPRATQPTLSASSVYMGSVVTINLPRASSNFTHDLTYRFAGGSVKAITTGAGASYSWTVPDLASSIPNATSGLVTITCVTKNGGTTVGSKTVTLTAKVPTSVVPTVGSVSLAEATAGLAAQFGAYIQGKSKLAVTIAASGAKGSTIKAYSTTLLGKTYTGSAWTSDVLSGKGSISLVTKVQDSRGRWSAAKTTTINVLAYSTPQVKALSAYRVDSTGAADEQGEYIAVRYKYSVTSLGSKNTAAVTIEYKRTTATGWTTLLTATQLSADTTAKPASPTFSTDYQYDIRITVTDWFGASRTYNTELPTGAVILDFKADGRGLGIGKVAQQEGIDLGWDWVGGVSNMGSQAGRWKMPGGPLIQWGMVEITPSATNTPTEKVVNFPVAYTQLPVVMVTPITTVPQNVRLGTNGRTLGSITIDLVRTDNLTQTVIHWLAVGAG